MCVFCDEQDIFHPDEDPADQAANAAAAAERRRTAQQSWAQLMEALARSPSPKA